MCVIVCISYWLYYLLLILPFSLSLALLFTFKLRIHFKWNYNSTIINHKRSFRINFFFASFAIFGLLLISFEIGTNQIRCIAANVWTINQIDHITINYYFFLVLNMELRNTFIDITMNVILAIGQAHHIRYYASRLYQMTKSFPRHKIVVLF